MNEILDVLKDSLIDAVKLLPILFVIYLVVEYSEHKNNNLVHKLFEKSKKIGPLLGGLFGTVPQCGFSVIASELFSKKAISIGTLIAIFVATSDEAIPLMLAHPDKIKDMLMLILIKFVIAVVVGFAIDIFVPVKLENSKDDSEHHFHGNCENCDDGVLKSAIVHSVKIFAFIFTINIVFGLFTEFLVPFMQFIRGHIMFQIFLSPVFGMIPNCAASVVLTELYLTGKIAFSALCGGLCTGAGVGILVLFKQNKNVRQNLLILATLYLIGVLAGLLFMKL